MKITIIMLTWNQLEEATKPCVSSLYEFTPESDFELIIVDNNSTDGTVEYLRKLKEKYGNVKVIFNEENTGYSKGNNIGLREIGDAEYICLLNNDVSFTPDWLDIVLDVFKKDEKIGMVSPRIQKGKKLTKENYLQKYKKYLAKFKGEFSYNFTPLFCCVIIKREVFDKVGYLDENFSPAWFEDEDYSLRVLYAGYKNALSNKSFVFHDHSTTSAKLPEKEAILKHNRKYFYEKHPLGKYIYELQRKKWTRFIVRKILPMEF